MDRPGHTRREDFSYETGAPKGLLENKKATFLIASGGFYGPDSPAAAMNFVEPYLRSLFAFIGVTDSTFINASGVARIRQELTARSSWNRPSPPFRLSSKRPELRWSSAQF